jgi:hypothetical protein
MEKSTYENLRQKLSKEVSEAQDERKSFAALKKKAIDGEKDRLEKKAANQVVAEEIRLEEKAKKEVDSARRDFSAKEKELRKTVLGIERAEQDMEKRTAALVSQKMSLTDQLNGAQEDLKVAHLQLEKS